MAKRNQKDGRDLSKMSETVPEGTFVFIGDEIHAVKKRTLQNVAKWRKLRKEREAKTKLATAFGSDSSSDHARDFFQPPTMNHNARSKSIHAPTGPIAAKERASNTYQIPRRRTHRTFRHGSKTSHPL